MSSKSAARVMRPRRWRAAAALPLLLLGCSAALVPPAAPAQHEKDGASVEHLKLQIDDLKQRVAELEGGAWGCARPGSGDVPR